MVLFRVTLDSVCKWSQIGIIYQVVVVIPTIRAILIEHCSLHATLTMLCKLISCGWTSHLPALVLTHHITLTLWCRPQDLWSKLYVSTHLWFAGLLLLHGVNALIGWLTPHALVALVRCWSVKSLRHGDVTILVLDLPQFLLHLGVLRKAWILEVLIDVCVLTGYLEETRLWCLWGVHRRHTTWGCVALVVAKQSVGKVVSRELLLTWCLELKIVEISCIESILYAQCAFFNV